MTSGDGGRLEPRHVRASVPRDNITQPREIRPSRGWLTVALGLGALPVAWLARLILGIDDHIVFAVLWAGAALLQVPPRVHRYDWLAVAGLVVYFVSFVLPAGIPVEGGAPGSRLLGYQVLLEPPVHPLPNLEGELLALAVGTTSWLANPAMIIALAFYRFREATWALVLGGLAVGMGALELPGAQPDLAQLAWLGGPALVALAGHLARADY